MSRVVTMVVENIPHIQYVGGIVGVYLTWRLLKPYIICVRKKQFAAFHIDFAKTMNECYKKRKRKETLFAPLQELHPMPGPIKILEIGAGPGTNLDYFPNGAEIICLEPNSNFNETLKKNAESYPTLKLLDIITGYGEDMDGIPSESVDVVVSTLLLCSVCDMEKVLSEIKRVLKPGGQFYYMEHVASQNWFWWFMQKLFKWPWSLIFDNCSLERHIERYIRQTGFSSVTSESFVASELPMSCTLLYPHIKGIATK